MTTDITPSFSGGWGELLWTEVEGASSNIKVQVLYDSGGFWDPVSDAVLPGNLAGFDISPVDLSILDTTTYPVLRIKVSLHTDDVAETPYFEELGVKTVGICWTCDGWTGTGSVPSVGSTNSVSFTIDTDSSITWNWKVQYALELICEPGDGGSLSVGPLTWHDPSTVVTVDVVANTGFTFADWSGDASGSNDPMDVTMDKPRIITANFVPDTVTLTVTSTYGTPSPERDIAHSYEAGTEIFATVDSYHQIATGQRYYCCGWAGTGSRSSGRATGTTA